jgi:hypothetical protein
MKLPGLLVKSLSWGRWLRFSTRSPKNLTIITRQRIVVTGKFSFEFTKLHHPYKSRSQVFFASCERLEPGWNGHQQTGAAIAFDNFPGLQLLEDPGHSLPAQVQHDGNFHVGGRIADDHFTGFVPVSRRNQLPELTANPLGNIRHAKQGALVGHLAQFAGKPLTQPGGHGRALGHQLPERPGRHGHHHGGGQHDHELRLWPVVKEAKFAAEVARFDEIKPNFPPIYGKIYPLEPAFKQKADMGLFRAAFQYYCPASKLFRGRHLCQHSKAVWGQQAKQGEKPEQFRGD